MNGDLVEKTIKDGHAIADKIRVARSAEKIEALMPEIEKYTDFVDENFGEWDEFFEEKENQLSFMLYMAAEEKIRFIENYHNEPEETGNIDLNYFLEMLDSRQWAKSTE